MNRNEQCFEERKQRERIIKQYEEVKRKVEEKELPQVKLQVRRSPLDVQRCNTETIKKQIRNAHELSKKIEKLPKGDIRRCMES